MTFGLARNSTTIDHPGPPPRQDGEVREFEAYIECDHRSSAFVCYTASNGAKSYGDQCTRCGKKTGFFCGHSKWVQQGRYFDPDTVPPFDTALVEAEQERRNEFYEQQREERVASRQSAWWRWYEAYLKSSAWQQKRQAVFKRCNFVCEGCGSAPAVQVHHLSYKNVGYEMLFDLVGICEQCHQRVHGGRE